MQILEKESLNIIIRMWNIAGMKVDIMDPEYHDMVLAITSHIPHIIAYSIVGTVSNLEKSIKKEVIKYAASGFKDFTRIAASDPVMWRDILISNKKSILDMLSIFKKDLANLENAIKREDSKFLYNLFSRTRLIRKKLTSNYISSLLIRLEELNPWIKSNFKTLPPPLFYFAFPHYFFIFYSHLLL